MSGISSGVGETSVRIRSKTLPYRAILMISDQSIVAAGADNVVYHLVKDSSGKWVTKKELSGKSGAGATATAAASQFSSAKKMVCKKRRGGGMGKLDTQLERKNL